VPGISLIKTGYKVVQIWPGQTVTCLHTNRPGHIWTTLYDAVFKWVLNVSFNRVFKYCDKVGCNVRASWFVM
jgi:hypothetical protein